MWVFTKDGFFSAVEKPVDKGHDMITIRARAKIDLENLLKEIVKEMPIIVDAGTDYEYRIRLLKSEWADYLAQTAKDIDYENFKHEVGLIDKKRANTYLSIWSNLLRVADRVVKQSIFLEDDYAYNQRTQSINWRELWRDEEPIKLPLTKDEKRKIKNQRRREQRRKRKQECKNLIHPMT